MQARPLPSSTRADAPPRPGYRVERPLAETPWYRLYAARKVFLNYRYDDRQFYEAGEDEWVAVLIRACPGHDDAEAETAAHNRRLLEYEAAEVLGRLKPWAPEPLDWLDGDAASLVTGPEKGDRHLLPERPEGCFAQKVPVPFSRPVPGGDGPLEGPLLVMSVPHGRPLSAWRAEQPFGSPQRLQVAVEILELLEALHAGGQILGGFGPDDFVIDDGGRLFLSATDRVMPAESSRELRPSYPPERFPPLFSPPEVQDRAAPLDGRGDLYSWAGLCLWLLADLDPSDSTGGEDPHAGIVEWSDARGERFETALKEAAAREPDLVWALSPERRGSFGSVVEAWSECIRRCLMLDRSHRPASIAELRAHRPRPRASRWWRRFWSWLRAALKARRTAR